MEKDLSKRGEVNLAKSFTISSGTSPSDPLVLLSRSLNQDKSCDRWQNVSPASKEVTTLAPCSSDKLKVSPTTIDRSTCFSSCENLRNQGDSNFASGRLSKAKSDNPVFGDESISTVPPVPPRDYLCHAVTRLHKPIEIHPVVRDGEKLSNTHYWLLPGKQHDSKESEPETKRIKEDYVNVIKETCGAEKARRAADQQLEDQRFTGSSSTKNKSTRDMIGKLLCDGRTVMEDDEPLIDPSEMNAAAVECTYDNMTVHAMLDPDTKISCDSRHSSKNSSRFRDCINTEERCTSLGEAKDMMDKVRLAVDGVTLEECQTALSMFSWRVDDAIKYLKTESLFRLAIASRNQCRQVLEMNHWDLNKAASHLLDLAAAQQ